MIDIKIETAEDIHWSPPRPNPTPTLPAPSFIRNRKHHQSGGRDAHHVFQRVMSRSSV